MAWQQPKTNWDTHPKAIEPADLNRIEGNIEVIRVNSDLPLRLEVVDSFPSHTPGRAIYHTGNKMAYVSDGNNWMTFASPQFTKTYTPGTTDQTIDEGYHKNSVVKGDTDLVAANIAEGKNIFGKVGTHTGHTLTASNNVRISANTARSLPFGTSISDSQKLKEIRIGKSGTVRVKLTAYRVGQGYWDCWVYKNGERYGYIGFGGSGESYYTHSDSGDITVSAGDLLQVYGCTNVSATLYTFEICYDLVPIPTATEAVLMD